jgi:hypothetical protein
MYDYLADNLEKPKVLLINCRLINNSLTAGLGFISMGIRPDRCFDLVDRRGEKVCQIELPKAGYNLPRDVALSLSEEQFKVLETYA